MMDLGTSQHEVIPDNACLMRSHVILYSRSSGDALHELHTCLHSMTTPVRLHKLSHGVGHALAALCEASARLTDSAVSSRALSKLPNSEL
jgi:hypothetical protein